VNIGKIKLYYNVKECFSFIFHNHFHISQFSLMAKLGSFAVSQKNECPLLTNFCQKKLWSFKKFIFACNRSDFKEKCVKISHSTVVWLAEK